MRRRIPTGIQDFVKLREKSMAYVDKTAYVWEVAQSGVPTFLSRPRRFGKSLLVSTLKAYWEGRSELFEGLEIFALESAREGAWTPHPVFHLDLDGANYAAAGALESKLRAQLRQLEQIWGIFDVEETLSDRFLNFIIRAHADTGRRAVVLVDEYDKPLLDTLSDDALTDRNRGVLKGFYGVLKEADEHLESVFVCGVTRSRVAGLLSAPRLRIGDGVGFGISEDPRGRFLFQGLPAVHVENLGAGVLSKARLVGDHHHGEAARSEIAHDLQNLRDHGEVEG